MNIAFKYEVCVVQLWCWCIPLSLAAEITQFESPAFEHSGFVLFPLLFPLSSTSKGWFSLQVLKVVMTSELLCMRCSCTLQPCLAQLRSGMLCISSVSTPCLVLILFFHREECDGRREVSKQKKIQCLYRLPAQGALMEGAWSAAAIPGTKWG